MTITIDNRDQATTAITVSVDPWLLLANLIENNTEGGLDQDLLLARLRRLQESMNRVIDIQDREERERGKSY